MNKVLTSKDIKSTSPILSCSAAVFKLGGRDFSARSSAFESMYEVEKFVNEHAGFLVIFDQPNLFVPDVPTSDRDKVVLRYVILPNFHDLISRMYQATIDVGLAGDLRKDLDTYFGK